MFILSSTHDHQHSQGICITCKHASGCAIRQQSLFAIWRCDQHLDEDEIGEPERMQISENETEDEKIPGLCMNCEHKRNCSLRSEGKVIFHCEEYL